MKKKLSSYPRGLTEAALRESEARYRLLIDNLPNVVFKGYKDWSVDIINDKIELLTGYSKEEFNSRRIKWSDIVVPEDLQKMEDVFIQALKTKKSYLREYRIKNKSGNILWIQEGSQIVCDNKGEIDYITGAFINITELKQAEEALRSSEEKYRAELEKRVIERTVQLEAANKELEAFSYSVSHDLRAPLRGIDGFSRILIEDYAPQLDEEGRRVLEVIISETKKMGQLIDDLLSFSRLSRGDMKLVKIDMTTIFNEIAGELLTVEKARDIRIKMGKLPVASADRVMLRQAIINLLSNAVKFTRYNPRALIEVGGYPTEAENIYYVKDNGVGFDMQYQDKLFGVFQRLHSPDEFEGTGVGLAIVQRIIHRHGGRVWAEGKVNEGAQAFFTLPIPRVNNENIRA